MKPFGKLFAKATKEISMNKEEKRNYELVKTRHQNRIQNLKDEISALKGKLIETEQDLNLTKSAKETASDRMINRISYLRYEIGVREEVISWLTY